MIKAKLSRSSFSVLLILITLWAISLACVSNTPAPREGETVGGCTILPKGFSQADLVGTWVAGSYGYPKSSDTLIIRSDGRYKQIIHLEFGSVEYESDWQAWSFEYRDNGTGYLHLDDYRTCAANTEESCEWVNAGKIPLPAIAQELLQIVGI